MEIVYLSKYDSDVENACKIVDFVWDYEREQGLTDEEIVAKYTQGYCSNLADAIRMVFGKCFGKEIDTQMIFEEKQSDALVHSHTYARLGDSFVDIFGAHTEEQAREFVGSGALENRDAEKLFQKNLDKFSKEGNIMFICLGYIEPKEEPTVKTDNHSFVSNRNL